MIIFGITGDLAKRYLLPALYHLCKDDLLPEQMVIIGTSRQSLDLNQFLGQVELCVLDQDKVCDPQVIKKLHSLLELIQIDPVQVSDYTKLKDRLAAIEKDYKICMNRLFYLSIPPQLYQPVIQNLGISGLNGSCQHGDALTRLLVEKPFGYDIASATDLIDRTAEHFTEDQMFRIDHYLAKETVQNILRFRQANPDIEDRWNGASIEAIDIEAYESLGIENRKFYDEIGALRDIIQSHLWQLVALLAMELPQTLTSQLIHSSKEKLLASIGPLPTNKVALNTTRGQYNGYWQDIGNASSSTETFAAVRFNIPTKRWQQTIFTVATGKKLNEKCTRIGIKFIDGTNVEFRIQPQPAVNVISKTPLITNFSDSETPLNHANPDAYERVLIDAIRGDHTLFASRSEILSSWRSLQPLVDEWAKGHPSLKHYQPASRPSDLLRFSKS